MNYSLLMLFFPSSSPIGRLGFIFMFVFIVIEFESVSSIIWLRFLN